MRAKRMSSPSVALLTMLAPISWGTTYIVISQLLPPDRPLLAAAWRVAPAGLVLVAIGLLRSRWRPRGRELAQTVVLALFNFAIFFPLLILAAYRLPGGVAAAAGGLQPLLVAVTNGWLDRRRPDSRRVVVGVVAAFGVALVALRPDAGYDTVGLFAAVGANVSFALGVVLTKRFPSPPNVLSGTGWQLLFSAVVLIPLAFVVEGAPPHLTGSHLVGFGYLSLVGTALAFVVWFGGIHRLPSSAPPLIGLAAPVTGAAIGWLALRQVLTVGQVIGFLLTIGAIAYGATRATRSTGDPVDRSVPDRTDQAPTYRSTR